MRIHPVNPAEAIIACFFDYSLNPQKQWVLEAAPTTRNLRMGRTYTTTITWDAAQPDKTAFTWSWQGRIDVSRYDGLLIQAALPSWATMKFSAKVDGRWQLISESPGCDAHEDYAGPFQGRILGGLRLEFVPHQRFTGSFRTYYIGVYHSGRLNDWLAYENPDVYPADWPEFIKTEQQWNIKPQIGLYFGVEDLPALRQKLSRQPYGRFADILRRQAHEYLALEPEKQIRRYQRCGARTLSYSARSRDRGTPLWRPMEQCAFFGLLDGDTQLTRMALRCALALACTDQWGESLVQHDFRGSACEWRSFYENHTCVAIAAVMDWAGGALTVHGRDVLCHSLYFKGLCRMKYDFARNEYIYGMNQGCVFSPGRIITLQVLRKYWPRVDWELSQAYKDLDETVRRTIYDDGGYGEGPLYYRAVAHYALLSYMLQSRQQQAPVRELVPPGFLKGADYMGMYVATAPPHEMLWLSDGAAHGRTTDWLAMFAAITGDERWNGSLVDSLGSPELDGSVGSDVAAAWLGTSVKTLIFGPSDLSRRRPMVPTFKIHASTGHATSLRETERGPIRLHLSGSSKTEGHSHQDKGAMILEAFGEPLLIDRGITFYGDPVTEILKIARLHNLLAPSGETGDDLEQINPCPAGVCPVGSGDEKSLHLEIDTTAAWGGKVSKMLRAIDSPDPLHFTITDHAELTEPTAVTFHLHSRFPLTVNGNTATFQAGKSKLLVTWDWTGEVVSAGEELCDGHHQPVNHLAVRAGAARRHRLVTRLEIE